MIYFRKGEVQNIPNGNPLKYESKYTYIIHVELL